MSKRMLTITIDGPSASGKSTTAKAVAKRLGYRYIDTGAMYRALALKTMREGVHVHDTRRLEAFLNQTSVNCVASCGSFRVLLDGVDVTDEIRESRVSVRSSEIAALPRVRQWMVSRQRRLGEMGGVVMEGRDIGTVVLPDADLKVYLDASREERARRRWLEQRESGGLRAAQEVLNELSERDQRDVTRKHSPLKPAPDAIIIDTSDLTVKEQIEKVLTEAENVLAGFGD